MRIHDKENDRNPRKKNQPTRITIVYKLLGIQKIKTVERTVFKNQAKVMVKNDSSRIHSKTKGSLNSLKSIKQLPFFLAKLFSNKSIHY